MSKIKKAMALVKAGDWKTLLRKGLRFLEKPGYRIRARIEDWRIGGISIDKRKPSRYEELGAYATQSTDYCWLDQIFKSFPLRETDVFVDVGCGEGRVLTYLYLRGFRGAMTGIELDADVAETARRRTEKCANIQIHCGNVLECGELLKQATAVYLFNPFNESVLSQFVALIEETCDHPVKVYYCNDIHRQLLDKREDWYILRRNLVHSPVTHNRYYTVYGYKPETREKG